MKKKSKSIQRVNFLGWTGLDSTKILLHIQYPIATEKVNIDQKHKNLQFTREYPIRNKEAFEDVFPDQEPKKTHNFGAVPIPFAPK